MSQKSLAQWLGNLLSATALCLPYVASLVRNKRLPNHWAKDFWLMGIVVVNLIYPLSTVHLRTYLLPGIGLFWPLSTVVSNMVPMVGLSVGFMEDACIKSQDVWQQVFLPTNN